MRALLMLPLCFALLACAEEVPPFKPYVLPSMPTTAAANKGVGQAMTDEKVTAPVEMSDLRETDHGPGRFMLCIRHVESNSTSRVPTYAVFFDNEDYKGARMSVMIDDCEKQAYHPYAGTPAAAATPAPAAAPTARHHHKQQQPPL
jgi:hypothetical protein